MNLEVINAHTNAVAAKQRRMACEQNIWHRYPSLEMNQAAGKMVQRVFTDDGVTIIFEDGTYLNMQNDDTYGWETRRLPAAKLDKLGLLTPKDADCFRELQDVARRANELAKVTANLELAVHYLGKDAVREMLND